MSSATPAVTVTIPDLNVFFAENMALISTTALLTYDWLLSIDHDASFVWNMRLNATKVLYIGNRLLWLATTILQVLIINPVGDELCKALTVIQLASPIARYIPWIVFSGLRAYALSGRNKLLTVTICFLSSGWIAPNVYTISNSWTSVNDPPRINCATHLELSFGVLQNFVYVSRGALLLSEASVVFMTWRSFRYGYRVMHTQVALQQVLLDNGVQCFVAPAMFVIATFCAESQGGDLAGKILAQVRDGITSVLISRFLLGLLRLGGREHVPDNSCDLELTTRVAHDDVTASSEDAELSLAVDGLYPQYSEMDNQYTTRSSRAPVRMEDMYPYPPWKTHVDSVLSA